MAKLPLSRFALVTPLSKFCLETNPAETFKLEDLQQNIIMKEPCRGLITLRFFRTFRIILALCVVCLIAWGFIHIKNSYDETVAIDKVRRLGGIVYTDGGFIDRILWNPPVWYVDLSNTAISDEDILLLENLPDFDSLNLEGTEITDRAVPYISRLHSLTFLNIIGTHISKDGERKLAELLPDCTIRREINIH